MRGDVDTRFEPERDPFARSAAMIDDGSISYASLPNKQRRMVHQMIKKAARQQRQRLLRTLVALSCMLLLLVVVGFMFMK